SYFLPSPYYKKLQHPTYYLNRYFHAGIISSYKTTCQVIVFAFIKDFMPFRPAIEKGVNVIKTNFTKNFDLPEQ
ncbi:MAG: hypothetical protein KAT52_10940, partial [Desulfobacterales bacterium]|nr:hypothetical protein [Desulfobacterales bacterium]